MIRNVLRRILRDKGISIIELTNKVGLSRTAIYNFMNKDTKTYRIKTMEAICRYLHMNISQIIYYEAPTQYSLIDYKKNILGNIKYPEASVILNKYGKLKSNYNYQKLTDNICDYLIEFTIPKSKIFISLKMKIIIYKNYIFIGYKNENNNETGRANFTSYFSNPHNLQKIVCHAIRDNNYYLIELNNIKNDLKHNSSKSPYINYRQKALKSLGFDITKIRNITNIKNKLATQNNHHYKVFVVPLSFIYDGYLLGLESELGDANSIYKDGGANGYKNISISFDLYHHNISNLHQDKITRTIYCNSNQNKENKKNTQHIIVLNPSVFKA